MWKCCCRDLYDLYKTKYIITKGKWLVHFLNLVKSSFDLHTSCCDSKTACCLSRPPSVSRASEHHFWQTAYCFSPERQREREREHRVVMVGNRGHKKIMISLLCKWQLKDTKCCRRCPCISRLVLIGTHPAAESLWPLTLICQNEAEGGGRIWHYALNQLSLMEKVIRMISLVSNLVVYITK